MWAPLGERAFAKSRVCILESTDDTASAVIIVTLHDCDIYDCFLSFFFVLFSPSVVLFVFKETVSAAPSA